MFSTRFFALAIASLVLSNTPLVSSPDLSSYRQFRFGMSLGTVAQLAGIAPEARVLYQEPELIQEVMWLPPRTGGSGTETDSVRKLLFSFYDDQLFRVVVTYDRNKTEGLTNEDLVEALSARYGPATRLSAETTSASGPASSFSDKILAHWETSQYSITLFRSSYLSSFGLVAVSKRLDALVKVATAEAILLDDQQAPQREVDRQQRQTPDDRLKQEAVRRVNKVAFRP